MSRSNRFSPEVRERAIRMVLDHQSDYPSQWQALVSISAKFGCTAATMIRETRPSSLAFNTDLQ